MYYLQKVQYETQYEMRFGVQLYTEWADGYCTYARILEPSYELHDGDGISDYELDVLVLEFIDREEMNNEDSVYL